jgi:hypothetical protein
MASRGVRNVSADPGGFDWKRPDYDAVYKRRAERLQRMQTIRESTTVIVIGILQPSGSVC